MEFIIYFRIPSIVHIYTKRKCKICKLCICISIWRLYPTLGGVVMAVDKNLHAIDIFIYNLNRDEIK